MMYHLHQSMQLAHSQRMSDSDAQLFACVGPPKAAKAAIYTRIACPVLFPRLDGPGKTASCCRDATQVCLSRLFCTLSLHERHGMSSETKDCCPVARDAAKHSKHSPGSQHIAALFAREPSDAEDRERWRLQALCSLKRNEARGSMQEYSGIARSIGHSWPISEFV